MKHLITYSLDDNILFLIDDYDSFAKKIINIKTEILIYHRLNFSDANVLLKFKDGEELLSKLCSIRLTDVEYEKLYKNGIDEKEESSFYAQIGI